MRKSSLIIISVLVGLLSVVCLINSYSLSLYHFSGTTFINLPLKSRSFRIEYQYDSFVEYEALVLEVTNLLKIKHNTHIITSDTGIKSLDLSTFTQECVNCYFTFNQTKLSLKGQELSQEGDLESENSNKKTLTFSSVNLSSILGRENNDLKDVVCDIEIRSDGLIRFKTWMQGPNGENERKGWIVKDEQYENTKQQNYATLLIKRFVKKFERFSLVHAKGFSVDVSVQDFKPSQVGALVHNVVRDENRDHELVESFFRKANHEYDYRFLELVHHDKQEKLTWKKLFHGILRQMFRVIVKQDKELYEKYFPIVKDEEDEPLDPEIIDDRSVSEEEVIKRIWMMDMDEIKEVIMKNSLIKFDFPVDISPIVFSKFQNEEVVEKYSSLYTNEEYIIMNEFISEASIAIERAVGYVKSIEFLKNYIADRAMAQVSHLQQKLISDVRERLINMDDDLIVIKFIILDPETCSNIYVKDLRKLEALYKKDNVILGYMRHATSGTAPLIVPGEAVIFHQRFEHRFNIMAKYNPALINHNIAHVLENKWLEYTYWESYCPGIMPKTVFLPDVLPEGTDMYNIDPQLFQDTLNKLFPTGWVAKGIWEYNSVGKIIYHKLNITDLVNSYRNSNFQDMVDKKVKILQGCEPIEMLNDAIKSNTHYLGWRASGMLKNAYNVLVQEFKPIFKEYRIECNSGVCPTDIMLDPEPEHNETKKLAREYLDYANRKALECLDKVPPKLRGMPLTADIAILNDIKTIIFIETNPGGNSWLLSNDKEIATSHNKFLKKYRTLVLKEVNDFDRHIHTGMTSIEQMQYLRIMMKRWNATLDRHSRIYEFLQDRARNVGFEIHEIDYSRINSNKPDPVPIRLISFDRRRKSIMKSLYYVFNYKINDKKGGKFDYLSALALFMHFKETEPDFYVTCHRLVTLARGKHRGTFREPFLNKFAKFELSFGNSTKIEHLSKEKSSKLGKFITSCAEYLLDMQALDIQHDDIREKLHFYFELFNFQDLSIEEIGKIIFSDKGPWDTSFFDSIVETLERGNKIYGIEMFGQSYTILKNFLSSFSERFSTIYAMKRTGFYLKGIDLDEYLRMWVLKIRNLYTSELFPEDLSVYKNDKSVKLCMNELLYTVTQIVYTYSDYSTYRLNRTVFEPEYQFLTKFATFSFKVVDDVELTGDIINSILLLSEESENSDLIYDAQNFIIENQSFEDRGFPSNVDEPSDLAATHSAVSGLIDHDYTQKVCCDSLGEMIPFEEHLKNLREKGLNMIHYDYYNTTMFAISQNLEDTPRKVSEDGTIENDSTFNNSYLTSRMERFYEVMAKENGTDYKMDIESEIAIPDE